MDVAGFHWHNYQFSLQYVHHYVVLFVYSTRCLFVSAAGTFAMPFIWKVTVMVSVP